MSEYMIPTDAKNVVASEYPFLVSDIMEYITTIKQNDKSISLLEAIVDYGFKNNITVESIGDAIKDDNYFKSFIEKDCRTSGLIASEEVMEEDW